MIRFAFENRRKFVRWDRINPRIGRNRLWRFCLALAPLLAPGVDFGSNGRLIIWGNEMRNVVLFSILLLPACGAFGASQRTAELTACGRAEHSMDAAISICTQLLEDKTLVP